MWWSVATNFGRQLELFVEVVAGPDASPERREALGNGALPLFANLLGRTLSLETDIIVLEAALTAGETR